MTSLQRTSLAALLLPFLFSLSSLGQGFTTAPVLPVAGDPQLLAPGDFNGDGRPDLAYLDALSGGSLHILLGNGDGSFHTSQVIPIAGRVTGQLDVADLNGDRIPDIVLGGSSITALLGRGDGTFATPVITTVSNSSTGHAAIADFDGDGIADLFIASAGTTAILKGDGKGGFPGLLPIPGNVWSDSDAFAVDLNGDGLPDLVAGSSDFSFAVALNRGHGLFTTPVVYATPQRADGTRYLMLADVNGDGHPDILFPGLYTSPGQLIASLGRADGTFAPASAFAPTGLHNYHLVGSADLHGDGRPRIFLAGSEGFGTVLGNSPQGSPMFEGSSMRQEQTVLADFNGDGIVDMATPDTHSIVILLGKADGTFASPQAQQIGSTIGYIQLADVNGDHIPDLLATTDLIFAGVGDGTFAPTPLHAPAGYGTASYNGGGNTFPFYPANFNGDGKLDLLALPEAFFVGNGAGSFTQNPAPRTMGTPFYYGAVADFDGDGMDDGVEIGIGAAQPPLGGVNIFMSRAQAFTAFPLPNGERSGPVVTGDFNGDGCQDLADAGAQHIVLYKGDCHGTLTYTGSYGFDLPTITTGAANTNPGDIARADVDGDGRADLIITLPLLNEAQVFYGNGDGTFTPGTPFHLSRSATYVSAADLDGDGRADLVFTGIGDAIVLYGSPDRIFGPERVLAAGFQPGKAALADLRGIGKPDLVLPNINTFNYNQVFYTGGYTYERFLNSAPAAGTSAATVTLTLPTSAVLYGSAASATVNVTATNSATIPSGFVSLQVDGTAFASAALDSQGRANLPLSSVDAGNHTVQLIYLGDVNFRTAAASGTLNVSSQPTTLSLIASPVPATTLQPVTLTATVSVAGTTPSGQVTFADGTTALGSATLDNTGKASFVTSALSAGVHQFTASFGGSQDFVTSQGTATQQIALAASATSVTVTPASSMFGANVLLTITVAGGTTSQYPTGVYTCFDGTLTLGSGTLAQGVGRLSTTALAAGSSTVTCSYPGDSIFAASVSPAASVNVSRRYPSTVALAITAAGTPVTQAAAGTAIQLSAQVTSNGAPVNQGQVVFCDGAAGICSDIHQLATAQLSAAGTATLTITPGPGSHTFSARFLGIASALPVSSSSAPLTITGGLLSSASLSSTGSAGSYTLSAQFSAAAPTPTGLVTFLDQSNNNTSLGTAPLQAGSSTSLFTSSVIPTPGSIGATSFADSNGDGHPDLALATGVNNGIQILLGNGDGTFKTSQTLLNPTPSVINSGSYALVYGDFNGDGHLDLAALHSVGNALFVYLGAGDGTFSTTPVLTTPPTNPGIFSMSVADINGDGKADIVAAGESNNTIVVFLGNGDGTFQTITTPSATPSPREIVLGDFNEDGHPDVVAAPGGANSLGVMLGAGDGTFQSIAAPVTGGAPISAAAADLNGDGHLDLAVTDDSANTVRILLGRGDGTFQVLSTSYPTGSAPIHITTGDFNGDGKVDLAVANELGNSVTILLGNGDGTFTKSTFATGKQPEYLAAADLNGDGRSELIVGNVGENDATLLLAQGAVSATATITNVSLNTIGAHLVQATYAGDSNYTARTTNSISLTGQITTTTLTLVATSTQINYGQTVTFTATLTPATVGSNTSDGEAITIQNGATSLGSCVLKAGTCSLTLSALKTGTYSPFASYAGDAALAPSVSQPSALTVQPGPASITLSVANHIYGDAPFSVIATSSTGGPFNFSVVSGPASISGNLVTLTGAGSVVLQASQPASGNYAATTQTATFTVSPAAQSIQLGVPGGAVYGGAPIAVVAKSSSSLPVALSILSGPGSLNGNLLSFTGAGVVVVAANQVGNANFTAAPQVTQSIQVSPAPVSLTWPATANLVYGTSLSSVLNAAVTAAPSATVPGTFTYSVAGSPVYPGTVLDAGTYILQTKFTPADTTRYTTAAATSAITISKAAAGVALTTSASTVFTGNSIVLTATVSAGSGTPTGTVTFTNGTTVLGTAPLSAGTAQLAVASLAVGTQTLSATYSGTNNFLASSSNPVQEVVQDFAVATPSQTPIVTAAGSTATTTFNVSAAGQTLPNAVTFSASGLPPGATATFNPASLPAGSTAVPVTVTFKLPSTTAHLAGPHNPWKIAFAMLLLIPAFGGRNRKQLLLFMRDRAALLLAAAALSLFVTSVSGCGGAAATATTTTPSAPTSYVVTLTATSGSLQHSTTITLQVK